MTKEGDRANSVDIEMQWCVDITCVKAFGLTDPF